MIVALGLVERNISRHDEDASAFDFQDQFYSVLLPFLRPQWEILLRKMDSGAVADSRGGCLPKRGREFQTEDSAGDFGRCLAL